MGAQYINTINNRGSTNYYDSQLNFTPELSNDILINANVVRQVIGNWDPNGFAQAASSVLQYLSGLEI